ncbi:TIGR04282 family arsenosugar biosynthesis glycosyltransferase [Maridesulfovibrio sp. FT414]|uniref:TIGR04282 family arsenosugar biosynthesis glycosyltransferase n=1 Tax=Maridesulfovibrio sp. FT414 TaxID=2979469 RepID=UPI003D801ABB
MQEALIFFIKYPEAGRVKTRLGRDIGNENAALLYRSFVEDMLDSFDRSGLNTLIFYDSYQPIEKYTEWLGKRYFHQQEGNDLGTKMHIAFEECFSCGFERCLLTGSDLPGLPPETIATAFAALKNSPACIGPADDGGYYLIGFQKDGFTKSIFTDMIWSTKTVYNETVTRLNSAALAPAILPFFSDVDTLPDLKKILNIPGAKKTCPRTCLTAERILIKYPG